MLDIIKRKRYREIQADPCKFCGIDLGQTAVKVVINPSKTESYSYSFYVSCFKCSMSGPKRPTRARAIVTWNYLMRSK